MSLNAFFEFLLLMSYDHRGVFKVEDGVLLHKPPGDDYVPLKESPLYTQSLSCQQGFQLKTLDELRLTEAAVLVISAQAAKTEPLFEYFKRTAGASINQRRSFVWNRMTKNPARWKDEDRLTPFFNFADAYGGIERLAQDFLEEPHRVREELDSVTWIGPKTASFFHYCVGGNGLATIDMHILEQAHGLGLAINEKYVFPTERKSGVSQGKKVRGHPSFNEYVHIEEMLKEFWEEHDVFDSLPDGSLDVNRWFTAFWLAGIQEDRFRRQKNNYHTRAIFEQTPQQQFLYPFSDDNLSSDQHLPSITEAYGWWVRQVKKPEQLTFL